LFFNLVVKNFVVILFPLLCHSRPLFAVYHC
jgi:hypothetical protein